MSENTNSTNKTGTTEQLMEYIDYLMTVARSFTLGTKRGHKSPRYDYQEHNYTFSSITEEFCERLGAEASKPTEKVAHYHLMLRPDAKNPASVALTVQLYFADELVRRRLEIIGHEELISGLKKLEATLDQVEEALHTARYYFESKGNIGSTFRLCLSERFFQREQANLEEQRGHLVTLLEVEKQIVEQKKEQYDELLADCFFDIEETGDNESTHIAVTNLVLSENRSMLSQLEICQHRNKYIDQDSLDTALVVENFLSSNQLLQCHVELYRLCQSLCSLAGKLQTSNNLPEEQ